MKELIKEYFGKPDKSPFTDMKQEREAYLKFLDMLCLLSVNQNEKEPERSSDRVGALLSDEVLVQAFEPGTPPVFDDAPLLRELFVSLTKRGMQPINTLFTSGNLSMIEMLAFLMALASAVSRKYDRIFAILSGESSSAAGPTAGLCHDLGRFFLTEEENDISILYSSDSFLNSVLFSDHMPEAAKTNPLRPLILKPVPLSVYMGEEGNLGDLSLCGGYAELPYSNYLCYPELLREIDDVYSAAGELEESTVIELCGACGSGREFLLRNLAMLHLTSLFCLDVRKLFVLDKERQDAVLSDLIAKNLLEEDMLYLYGVSDEGESGRQLLGLLAKLQTYVKVFFLGSEREIAEDVTESMQGTVYRIRVPEADILMQQRLWEEALIQYNAKFDEDVSLSELTSKYLMNPGRIYEAVKNAIFVSDIVGDIPYFLIRKKDIEEQIRRICAVQFKENAKRLSSPFTWSDMVLEPESEALLKQVCDRVRFKSVVNEDYGFGKKLPYGRGIAVVLYGPPGTGKTMAAQVLANELGLDIYRIDLSQISSKYIGETEKNLGSVFDAARNSNAILFFDEADALFSKRTEVTSSNDKHANAETSYLLQKIEEYPGMSILATNNMQNFDAAFKRRMTYLVSVGIPDEETRAMLWEKAFPAQAPLGKDVNFKTLAKAVEMSGSNIKSAAVAAAYLAAADKGVITMNHIADAVDQECKKNGKMNAKNDILQAMTGGF